ncbi:hypothetical protein H5410_058658 [Solanum commersonii]|uniref:Uncharacterized protein n=1 Tax=Solanum commersonii TaxID=4109 RepID=A0A9J5WTT2_SOLCO|nr:hypothetical protein H5410_058658 [Solanum commersonii]
MTEIGRVAELLHVLNGFNGLSQKKILSYGNTLRWKPFVNKLYIKEVNEYPVVNLALGSDLEEQDANQGKVFLLVGCRRACSTHEKLKRRGFSMLLGALSNETEETNNHLFLHCKVTTQLGGRKSKKKWWSIIPSCIWWCIWKERNSRCYDNKANSIEKVKWNCLTTFYFWCKEEGIEETAQILDFIGTL